MLTWGGLKAASSNEGRTMKYVILKSCVAAGASRKVGDIIDLNSDEASSLLSYGRVAVAPEPKPISASTNRVSKPKSVKSKK